MAVELAVRKSRKVRGKAPQEIKAKRLAAGIHRERARGRSIRSFRSPLLGRLPYWITRILPSLSGGLACGLVFSSCFQFSMRALAPAASASGILP